MTTHRRAELSEQESGEQERCEQDWLEERRCWETRFAQLESRLRELEACFDSRAADDAVRPVTEFKPARTDEAQQELDDDNELLLLQERLGTRTAAVEQAGSRDTEQPGQAPRQEPVSEAAGDMDQRPSLFMVPPSEQAESPANSLLSGESFVSDADSLPNWAQSYQEDDVDDSVRDYISRLLGKSSLGETSPNAEESPSKTSSELCRNTPKTPRKVSPQSVRTSAAEETKPDVMSDDTQSNTAGALVAPYVPRSLPSEQTANLAAMRELANMSAETAIQSFERTENYKQTIDKLPVVFVGTVCGLLLLYWSLAYNRTSMVLSASVAFIVAIVATWQLLSFLNRRHASQAEARQSVREQALARESSQATTRDSEPAMSMAASKDA